MKTFDDVIDRIDTLINNDMDVDVINDVIGQIGEKFNLDTEQYGCTPTGLEEACFELKLTQEQINEICEATLNSLQDSV